MTKPRKIPLRTCVACRKNADKRDLVRVVRTTQGDVLVDPSGKANGRGAYVCPASECFESALANGRIATSLKVRLSEEDSERLRGDFESALDGLPASSAGRR